MPYSSADPNAYLALGIQSALGTAQVTAANLRYAKYLAGNDVQVQNEVVDLREGGDGLDFGFSYKKSVKVEGNLVLNFRPEIGGLLLAGLIGMATWDAASLPAGHTFHTGHASYPWYTILTQHPGSAVSQLISDVRLRGFTLEGVSGEPWKLTIPYLGITPGASLGSFTPTYRTDDAPLLFHNSPTYAIGGTADTDITGFKITADFGVEELMSQAITLDEAVVQSRSLDVEFTRRFENATLWGQVNHGGGIVATTSVATSSFEAAARAMSGASLRELRVVAPLVSLRSNVLTELDPDGKTVMETVSGRVLKGATHALYATLKNAHASAYA